MYFRWKEFITLASSAVVGAGLTLIGATSGCLDGIINTSHDDSQQKTVSATFDDTNPAYDIMGITSSLQDVTDSPDDVKDATEGVRRIHDVLMSSKDSILKPSKNKQIFGKMIDVSDSGLTDTITADSLDAVINEPTDNNLAVITSQAFMQSDVVDERVVVSQEDYKNSFSSDLLSNMTQSETIVSITKLTKDFIEKLNSGELYPNILRVYTYSLLKSMPKGFVPESFIEQYFDEFFPSYLEFVGKKG